MARAKRWEIDGVFERRRAGEYALKLDALWHEVVVVQDSMYVLEEVIDFPADLLLGPEQHRFLDLVKRHFAREVSLGVMDLLSDTHPRLMTLPGFQSWILKACRPDVRKRLAQDLERIAAPPRLQRLRERAARFHSEIQGHLDLALDPRVRYDLGAEMKDLSRMVGEIERLCSTLCLGREPGLHEVPYSAVIRRPSGRDAPTDVEDYLSRLARSSPVLRMPEENPERWVRYSRSFAASDRKVFNLWRAKVGRPAVEF